MNTGQPHPMYEFTDTAILRFEVPVTIPGYRLMLPGEIVAWGCRRPSHVELWAWVNRPGDTVRERVFSVYGTGHPVRHPAGTYAHRATVASPEGGLIWHVVELALDPSGDAALDADITAITQDLTNRKDQP